MNGALTFLRSGIKILVVRDWWIVQNQVASVQCILVLQIYDIHVICIREMLSKQMIDLLGRQALQKEQPVSCLTAGFVIANKHHLYDCLLVDDFVLYFLSGNGSCISRSIIAAVFLSPLPLFAEKVEKVALCFKLWQLSR